MNEQERAEVESLKRRQNELLRETTTLAEQLRGKEMMLEGVRRDLQRLWTSHGALELERRRLGDEISSCEAALLAREAVPTVGERSAATAEAEASRQERRASAMPPPIPAIPPVIPTVPAITPRTAAPLTPALSPLRGEGEEAEEGDAIVTDRRPLTPALSPGGGEGEQAPTAEFGAQGIARPTARTPFELRLGTYWLVRVGIVMLLTGIVFLGTYAYKNWVGRIGPSGKVALLYLMSGALLGVGAWLYRTQEKLKNYAQVLFAGGLAAVYFTTYGAHHIPALQVITNPVLDGALLLLWAAYVVWLADRRKSEVIALFAVGLAFYSAVITHVGLFTLYSNLILTATGVFFLVRNRWATLSTATLFASYGGYVFWRFYHGGEWHWASPEEGLWKGIYFLMSYWLLFTAAVFTGKVETFTGRNRAGFLSLNNAAFFTLFLLTMLQVHHGGFWRFALSYGTLLLALAVISWLRLREDKLCANAYLTQGLVLVTIGFVAHYTGLKLAMILASESVLLTLTNRFLGSRIIQLGAYATGVLSIGWAVTTMMPDVRADLITGAFLGAAMILNAAISRAQKNETVELVSTILFTVLALVVWFVTTWQQAHGEWRALALAIESLGFVLASRPLRNFALRYGALPYAAVAVGWAMYTMNRDNRLGLYVGIGVGAVVLLDDLLSDEEETPLGAYQGKRIFSLLALVIWFATTWVFTPAEHRAAVLAAEGVLFLIGFRLVNVKALTYGGLGFVFIAQLLCVLHLLPRKAALPIIPGMDVRLPWWNPALVGVISLGIAHWARRQNRFSISSEETNGLQLLFVLPLLGIIFLRLHPSFSPERWLAFTTVLAIVVTIYGLLTRLWVLAAAGQIFIWYSAVQFFRLCLLEPEAAKPQWLLALVPAIGFAILSLIGGFLLQAHADDQRQQLLRRIGIIYRATAIAISILWVFRYIHAPHYVWVLGLLGLCCFAANAVKSNRELLVISGVYAGVALITFWSKLGTASLVYWPNLFVLVGVLAQQAIAQRWQFSIPREVHAGAILIALASIWLWVSKWVSEQAGDFYLTATWAMLALIIFAAGFVLKERIYRWSGLVVLTCALGRVVVLDIWRLETIYRILSFMALGVVLLVLGFIYTKYQEKIREWL